MRTSITMTSISRSRASRDGGQPVAGLADHGHVLLRVKHHAKAGAHQFLVVDQRDADGHAATVSSA